LKKLSFGNLAAPDVDFQPENSNSRSGVAKLLYV